MKLSTKSRYGARAIVEIAKNFRKHPTKRKDIASRQGITDSYLENILLTLKTGNIIDTIRGAKGGFVLKRSPSEITLLDIVRVLEGSLELVECLSNPSLCKRVSTCVTRPVWRKIQLAQEEILRNITVQHLVEKKSDIRD